MPSTLHPPYLPGAVVEPRQLDRWLDINAQNGPLGRTQTFVTLPSFSVDVEWQGYSDIVAAFNFEGPNNFSLTSLGGNVTEGLASIIQKNPNYLLCIMWIDSTTAPYNTVHRYAIWQGVGEVMYVPYPLYIGQLIKKNFRLEVWSVEGQAIASQSAPFNIYTSKLGGVDYRYGTDSALVLPDNIVTEFSVGTTTTQSLPADMGLLLNADPSGMVGDSFPPIQWNTKVPSGGSQLSLLNTGAHIGLVGSLIAPVGLHISISQNDTFLSVATPNWGIQCLVLCCRMTSDQVANSFLFSAYPTGIAMFWNNGVVSAGGSGPNVAGLGYNVWYTFVLFLNGGQMSLYVYNTQTGGLVGQSTTLSPAVTYTNTLALGNAGMDILEIAVGSNTLSASDLTQINQYFTQKYFTGNYFALPFVWPAGSYPQLN